VSASVELARICGVNSVHDEELLLLLFVVPRLKRHMAPPESPTYSRSLVADERARILPKSELAPEGAYARIARGRGVDDGLREVLGDGVTLMEGV
jgi:hypothetical protein